MKGGSKMISTRLLNQWRKDALKADQRTLELLALYGGKPTALGIAYRESQYRILRLTQELMDLYLMKDK